ncbi:MAG TPA: adenylate/guanylate cyclase domain-containing protein [Streptosporangiaceae bacterium]|nr:adenylate/guanylate cyclase domain-containing protein [Streptosporangiaceae bacterium]
MPETRFTRVDDLDIAYQVVGPPAELDVVLVPGWVSHLEVMWELPEFARFLDRFAAMGRLIVFDKRGTGLSDRVTGTPTLEQRADDIAAVMDAAGSRRAAIAAFGEGAAIGAMFAATYPERVAALVLGSLAVKVTERRGQVIADPEAIRALAAAVETGWGQAMLVPLLAPSRAEDNRFLAWYRRWERMSSTPSAAAATLRWAAEFDLRPVLPAIQARTLIVHRSDSALYDLESVRAAVKLIPDARSVELPGVDALEYVGDTDATMDTIQEFLTGTQPAEDLDRSLATVLFTDIVGSTQKAGQLGDRRWRYLLDEHHARIRRMLDRFRGNEVDTAGDGFFATFDGPARAIRCACAARDAVREVGVEIRAGLHTGEVERRGTAATGLAVHVGARVAALAQASEVLVTNTVKTLVLGSGIGFADRGLHQLKGVPDEWQLFVVEHT